VFYFFFLRVVRNEQQTESQYGFNYSIDFYYEFNSIFIARSNKLDTESEQEVNYRMNVT
jgi:hypothetical protein